MVVLLGLSQSSWSQTPRQAGPEVEVGKVIPEILVNLKFSTGETALFVPRCGEWEGTPIMCDLGVHLQVHSPLGWYPARLRTTFAILGGAALGQFGGRLIPPRTEAHVVFLFSRRYFDVEPGQELRLIVDSWADEESMKKGALPTRLASRAFECPQAGLGQ
jgi:hypothetical protein